MQHRASVLPSCSSIFFVYYKKEGVIHKKVECALFRFYFPPEAGRYAYQPEHYKIETESVRKV